MGWAHWTWLLCMFRLGVAWKCPFISCISPLRVGISGLRSYLCQIQGFLCWWRREGKLVRSRSLWVEVRTSVIGLMQLLSKNMRMASLRLPDSIPSPAQDSERLNLALQGRGVDEQVIVWILGHRNAIQRKQIKDTYQQLYKESIIHRLQSKLSSGLKTAMILWMNEAPERDAILANKALKRKRKKINQLQVLVEIACASSPDHLMAVRQAYCSLYECSLEEDITSNISTSLQKLLVGLVSSYRHDRELVDFNLAKSEADKIHEAIEKNQLDHDDVVWILTTRNFFQLRATFVCYKQSYEVAIDQAINSSGNGDLGSILRGVILCIVSPEKHFAEVIKASTVGYWTKDEDSLTRAIVTRAEIDMTKIKGEYFKMNNTNLDDVVRRDTSGVYKSFLMALIGAKI
uniref:Annexin D3 n=1 Tax=Vitis vinifera TaxID=29760 RepID=F6HTM4_VITVI